MRFLIFGSDDENKKKFNFKEKYFMSGNFDIALDKYNELLQEIRYNNLYLVADFGQNNDKSLFSYTSLNNDYDDELPFFIVLEWHLSDQDIYPADICYVETSGFNRTFVDNVAAVKNFLYCIENHQVAKLSICYAKIKENIDKEQIFIRQIVNSIDIVRYRARYTKKFDLDNNDWYCPKSKLPIAKLYKLEKQQAESNIKELKVM